MNSFRLDIVTPERVAYAEDVEKVLVPSAEGQLTILPHHVHLFATLAEGEVKVVKNQEDYFLAIGGGFIEGTKTKVIILVSRAYHAHELNEEAILKAKEQAEEAIAKGVTGSDLQAAQMLLRSSLVDLKVYHRRRKQIR